MSIVGSRHSRQRSPAITTSFTWGLTRALLHPCKNERWRSAFIEAVLVWMQNLSLGLVGSRAKFVHGQPYDFNISKMSIYFSALSMASGKEKKPTRYSTVDCTLLGRGKNYLDTVSLNTKHLHPSLKNPFQYIYAKCKTGTMTTCRKSIIN